MPSVFEYKFPDDWEKGQRKEYNRHCIKLQGALTGPPMPPVHPEFDGKIKPNQKLQDLYKRK